MKKLLLFLLFFNLTFAQVNTSCNLVSNGDFEQYDPLPTYHSQLNRSLGWSSPSIASPDYFHQNVINFGVQIPCNLHGYENAYNGNAYAGIYAIKNTAAGIPYYEMIKTKLVTPLLPNTNYKLSFYVSLAEGVSSNHIKLQAYLSNANIFINSSGNLPISNSTMLFTNPSYSTNTNGWDQITFNITTGGTAGEEYLYIGAINNVDFLQNGLPSGSISGCNFINQNTGFNNSAGYSYYYIDNVELSRVIDAPIINLQSAFCSGSSATLSIQNPQSGLIYKWYSSSTSSVILATGTTFTTPNLTTNTSYWVEAYDPASGCKSVRVEKKVIVGLPSVGNKKLSLCQGSPSLTLSVAPTIPNGTIKWYSSPTGGTALLSPPTITTSLVGSVVYYFSQTNGTCESARSAYTITINALPSQPLVQTETSAVNFKHICKIRPQILYAYPVLPGAKYYWSAPVNSGVSINSNPNNEYALFTFNPSLIVNGSTIPITLTIVSESGCSNSGIITLKVYPNATSTTNVTVPLGDVTYWTLGSNTIYEKQRGLVFDANQFQILSNNNGNTQSVIYPPYNLNNNDSFTYKPIALSASGSTNDIYQYKDYGKSGCDCIVLKYTVLPQNISSKNSSEDIKSSINLYPNPAKTTITINGIEKGNSIEIYDLQGKLLLTKESQSTIEIIDVSQFAKGIYLAKITTVNQEITTIKFVVEN